MERTSSVLKSILPHENSEAANIFCGSRDELQMRQRPPTGTKKHGHSEQFGVPIAGGHVNLPERRPGRWGQGITPAVMKRCSWVEPMLVAQVKFTEWTSDDQLRQPVFLGLRTDKQAK